MPKFDRLQIEALKEYLYYSYVHDSKIDTLGYDKEKKNLVIELVNPIFGDRICLSFEKVKVVLSISGNEFENGETIISLTAEEDYSYLQNCTGVCVDNLFDYIYLLFQMFSGNELHIVCEKVFIEIVK